jgi:hypothetical protein
LRTTLGLRRVPLGIVSAAAEHTVYQNLERLPLSYPEIARTLLNTYLGLPLVLLGSSIAFAAIPLIVCELAAAGLRVAGAVTLGVRLEAAGALVTGIGGVLASPARRD